MSASAIHQLVHTLTFGDAISGEVLQLQRCFRDCGRESEIFALNIDPKYRGCAQDYRRLPEDLRGEVILHYSLGSPLNDLYRRLGSARRGLIYHNLTPAHWFRRVNSRIAAHIEKGLQELPELCRLSERLLADSDFNAGELEALGFKAGVLNLPVDSDKWRMPANAGIEALVKNDPSLHVLHVGRMAPNKCLEDIIRVFHFLHKYITSRSRLWLVGLDIDTEVYSFALKRLARELDLEDSVNFAGRMADSEVKALYQNCSVYLCMSGHEGFCLPVVEAMFFGLPVAAFAATALPDTVGSGGILFREKKHAEIAELLFQIQEDAGLRARIVEAGRRRADQLSFENFRQRVGAVFGI